MITNKYGVPVIILLIAIIVTGSMVIWSKSSRSQPIAISIDRGQKLAGEIYIGGAVNNPGFYPLRTDDRITNLIQAAGGTSDNADFNQVRLYVPHSAEELPQQIDINRAEAWLLQTLPGIGEVRTQAIIAYRQQNGRFHNTAELLKVAGIGTATYENIKHLITVAD